MPTEFGLVPSGRGRGRGGSRGNSRGWARGSFRGRGRGQGGNQNASVPVRRDDGTLLEERFESVRVYNEIDEKLGFSHIPDGATRDGWLVNMHPVCRFIIFTNMTK
jgi:DNA polymerase epsilon subunit 1